MIAIAVRRPNADMGPGGGDYGGGYWPLGHYAPIRSGYMLSEASLLQRQMLITSFHVQEVELMQ